MSSLLLISVYCLKRVWIKWVWWWVDSKNYVVWVIGEYDWCLVWVGMYEYGCKNGSVFGVDW